MKPVGGVSFAKTMVLGATLLAMGGCGYKNLPVPPETVVPKPIEDLRYTLGDQGVTLTWTYPTETIKGTEITEVTAFDLYRAEIPLADYCATCPIPYGEPLELAGGLPLEEGQRRTATYESDLLRTDHKYFFKVRSRNNWWGSSADSNVVTFIWHVPAAAPQGLTAEGTDGAIKLSWQPVTTQQDGEPLSGSIRYQVLRNGGGGFEPLGRPVKNTSLVDREVENGLTYQYRVQALVELADELVAGEPSAMVSGSAVDRTPPEAPSGVNVVQGVSGVKIVWDRSADEEVAGYRIYRRQQNSTIYKMIGEVEAAFTIFTDQEVADGQGYYWAVSAIDGANPANESARSEEATVRR